ncbi:MFS multidrug transporter [Rhexocercosporidium sp. MPI-PUGE-AT-0058]|nr:MFS multidrug transporter [Rhexocercosporidium sp. MPI-PUGE-AT-0058]
MEKHEGPQRDRRSSDHSPVEPGDAQLVEAQNTSSIVAGSDPTATGPPPTANTLVEEEWEYVTGWRLYVVIGIVALASFLMLLDTSIIVTAIPRITSDFHSLGDVGWYGSSYLLASCALLPSTGRIYSQFNSKYTFVSFLALFELGSLICALSNSSNMLIVGRAIAGMGGSGLSNGGLTIISACVPLQKRAAYLGFLMSFAQLGILFGPLIGGALTEHATWRWCFWINLPCGGVVAGFLLMIAIPDRNAKSTDKVTVKSLLKSLDLLGFALFAPTAIMFLLALEWGGTKYAWDSATVIGLFCGAAGTLPLFCFWEYRKGEGAMIPWPMVKQRVVWSSCLTMICFFGNQLITSYYLAIYFQAVRGVAPTLSGVYVLPGILSQMFAAMFSGVLVGRLGYYLPWSIGSSILAAISSGLISTYNPNTSTGIWIGYQIIGGFGRGCGLQMPVVAIQNTIPASQNSVGMSLVAFSQTFGGAIFLSVAQTGFGSALRDALHKHAPEVSPAVVAQAGATGFRAVIAKASIPGVIEAYSTAVAHAFYIASGASVACFVFAWGMGWKSIKKAKVAEPAS